MRCYLLCVVFLLSLYIVIDSTKLALTIGDSLSYYQVITDRAQLLGLQGSNRMV